ncbi:MAG: winged helix-turn-helix domain-containing protein [Candidatus Omnitrophica bacterium]|nr:winged helix-turn-helix domain-containing protein [Candidatus Omnitrophota bacterium]
MITRIGIVAGEIWHLLERKRQENAALFDLAENIKEPQEIILMSLGWLAREGHVVLERINGGYRFSL